MKHEKTYRGLENGSGQIVCSCGYETPAVDESTAFTLGTKPRSVESYFEEHVADSSQTVATTMLAPAERTAVTPAQRPQAKKRK